MKNATAKMHQSNASEIGQSDIASSQVRSARNSGAIPSDVLSELPVIAIGGMAAPSEALIPQVIGEP